MDNSVRLSEINLGEQRAKTRKLKETRRRSDLIQRPVLTSLLMSGRTRRDEHTRDAARGISVRTKVHQRFHCQPAIAWVECRCHCTLRGETLAWLSIDAFRPSLGEYVITQIVAEWNSKGERNRPPRNRVPRYWGYRRNASHIRKLLRKPANSLS